MPIFVYEPVADGESVSQPVEPRDCCHFEVLQWSSEAPLLVCPQCGGAVRRAVTEFSTQTRAAPTSSPASTQQKTSRASDGTQSASPIISSEKKSAASRAARLAYQHVCGKNCRH